MADRPISEEARRESVEDAIAKITGKRPAAPEGDDPEEDRSGKAPSHPQP